MLHPPPFPTALHTRWSTRYPTSLYATPLPPSPQHCTPGVLHGTPSAFMSPQHCTPGVLHGTPSAFMEHPSPLPHSTAHRVYYTVLHQPLWNTPPPFPTASHTRCTTWYPTSLYGTPLSPFPTALHTGCTTRYPTSLYGTPLPPFTTELHTRWSTRYPTSLYGTPLPPFPTELHTRWSTRYPTNLYGTPLPPSTQHCTPGGLHGTPPAFMQHPSPLPHSTAHRVYYTVPHQPLWNTPPPFPIALHTGCTTRYPISLYATPPPLPHSTAHHVVYTVPHQPLCNTPPPFPTALHTGCTTRYPISLYGTPLPPSPQHCTPGVLHGTPSAFMEHPSPLPHSIAHQVYYMVPHQPLWNTAPPLPHSTAHRVYYTVPHQPLWNTPPPFPTALHTGCTTRYPISLYGTPLPPSP